MVSIDTVLVTTTIAGIALTLSAGLFVVPRRRGLGWSPCLRGNGIHDGVQTPLLSGRADGRLLAKASPYADEDGVATAESAQQFWRRSDNVVRWLIALQVFGLWLSFADALSSQLRLWNGDDNTTVQFWRPGTVSLWLRVGLWVSKPVFCTSLGKLKRQSQRFGITRQSP